MRTTKILLIAAMFLVGVGAVIAVALIMSNDASYDWAKTPLVGWFPLIYLLLITATIIIGYQRRKKRQP